MIDAKPKSNPVTAAAGPPRKYYSAFVFYAQDVASGQTLQLHCTHKYFGAQDANTMGFIARTIDKYFKTPRVFPMAVFNKREDFGHQGGPLVSVLTTPIDVECFFPDLRELLNQFRKDDFPQYVPHITVPEYPEVIGQFQAYAILEKEKIVMWWRNPEWARQEKREQEKLKAKEAKKNPSTGSAPKTSSGLTPTCGSAGDGQSPGE